MVVLPPPIRADPSADGAAGDDLWSEASAPVRSFLTQVGGALIAQAESFDADVAAFARYALEARGKQLRPALVGLVGGALGGCGQRHVVLATVIEMIHVATLAHDDVMDAASLRRGRPTLAARWGNEVAVLAGDCLFAHALGLAADLESVSISRRIALAAKRVCSGEIAQTLRRGRWSTTEAEYYRVIELKTAELFAAACELAAELSGAGEPVREAMRLHGFELGVAYQIYDDSLDFFGTERGAGKSLGTDLATGKLTLPLLLLFARVSPAEKCDLIEWLDSGVPGRLDDVRSLLAAHGTLGDVRRVLEARLGRARTALADLPPGPCAHGLLTLANFVSAKAAHLAAG